ncbi:MAG: hypothetical protein AAF662_03440 [Pseudomonadota bacterium]
MTQYAEFDSTQVSSTIAALSQQQAVSAASMEGPQAVLSDDGHVRMALAACISVTVSEGKICLNLPFDIGDICLPIPPWVPEGTAAKACIDVCSTFGVPTGIEVTVSALDTVLLRRSWGRC